MNKEIIRLVRTTPSDTCECRYFVYEDVGYKIFNREEGRDYAFFKQLKAFRHGFAPEPFCRMECDGYFLYTTEHCGQTVYELGFDDTIFRDAIRDLKSIGMKVYDDHGNNFCFKDGKVVCVDFGRFTFEDL